MEDKDILLNDLLIFTEYNYLNTHAGYVKISEIEAVFTNLLAVGVFNLVDSNVVREGKKF